MKFFDEDIMETTTSSCICDEDGCQITCQSCDD